MNRVFRDKEGGLIVDYLGLGDAKLKVIAAELIAQVRKSVTIDWILRERARAKIRVIV